MNKMKPSVVLKKFFGQKPGQTLVEFVGELKQLSKEETLELAGLAAVELGVEVETHVPGPLAV